MAETPKTNPPKAEGTSPDPTERATQEKIAKQDLKKPEGELKGKNFNPFDRKTWTLKGGLAWAIKEGSEIAMESVIIKNITDIFKKSVKEEADKVPTLTELLGEETSDEFALVLGNLNSTLRDTISQWSKTLGNHQRRHFADNIVHMAFRKNHENDPVFGSKGFDQLGVPMPNQSARNNPTTPLRVTLGVLRGIAEKRASQPSGAPSAQLSADDLKAMTEYAVGLGLILENEEKYKLHRMRDEAKEQLNTMKDKIRQSNQKFDDSLWGHLSNSFIR